MKLNKLAGYRSMLNIPRKNIAELLQISNVAYGKKRKRYHAIYRQRKSNISKFL